MITFRVNGKNVEINAEANIPLLWIIREAVGLTGTKFGCGIAQCGACTVHVDEVAVRSCQMTVGEVEGKSIVTIEGLAPNSDHPLQKAWVAEQVAQCGYCQSGQIMQAADLLRRNPRPTRQEIIDHMDGNICRCGTYPRILRAIERAVVEG